jgi:hypothetical protein
VLVSSIRLVIQWPDRPILVLDVICPPCPLLTNSSTNILAALENHPILKDTVQAIYDIRSTATLMKAMTNEFDGASGNDKLHAAMSTVFAGEDGCCYERLLCGNHQQHLVSLSVLALLDIKLTTSVLSASSFLSGSGHWARLVNLVGNCIAGLGLMRCGAAAASFRGPFPGFVAGPVPVP